MTAAQMTRQFWLWRWLLGEDVRRAWASSPLCLVGCWLSAGACRVRTACCGADRTVTGAPGTDHSRTVAELDTGQAGDVHVGGQRRRADPPGADRAGRGRWQRAARLPSDPGRGEERCAGR